MCRVFKHALRAGKEHFNPIVGELIDFFVASFRETHVSSFLYACSICVGEFGGRSDRVSSSLQQRFQHTMAPVTDMIPPCACLPQAHEVALMKMLSDTSGQVVALLSPPNGLQDHPDVVEEYFYLVARFLSTCPQPLLQNHRQSGILVILDLGACAQGTTGTTAWVLPVLTHKSSCVCVGRHRGAGPAAPPGAEGRAALPRDAGQDGAGRSGRPQAASDRGDSGEGAGAGAQDRLRAGRRGEEAAHTTYLPRHSPSHPVSYLPLPACARRCRRIWWTSRAGLWPACCGG